MNFRTFENRLREIYLQMNYRTFENRPGRINLQMNFRTLENQFRIREELLADELYGYIFINNLRKELFANDPRTWENKLRELSYICN